MPGWIIQGVRGEGKTLCAVGKIREYLERGCPVATNLDLNLDKLVAESNSTLCYRLPDHPRACDLELLPPAYDPAYKDEDKNGLLVLDELGTWLNSRSWNDKTRSSLMNWLFLSRKDHWDLILITQDVDLIDSQIRTTCCDFLVQASRLDRQKIPYLASTLEMLGFSSYLPKIHVYYVYYGLSTQNAPQETWKFSGKDLYDGYDTNQRFTNGNEVVGGKLTDMRATYTYVPANILSRHKFIDALNQQIQGLKNLKPLTINETTNITDTPLMAARRNLDNSKIKAYLLLAGAVLFLGYRFIFSTPSLPKTQATAETAVIPAAIPTPIPTPTPIPASVPTETKPASNPGPISPDSGHAIETESFMTVMLANYRPRLSSHAYSEELGFMGYLEWYDGKELVEKLSLSDLHAFGALLVKRPYGIELVHNGKRYAITSWPKKQAKKDETLQMAGNP